HFPGRVSRADLDQLYADCDLFVMPSAREGFGLVFLDAMAAGRPCIGAAGAAAEIIVPGVTGLLVAPHDGPGLLEAIVSLLHDPARRRLMGEAGARAVAAQFTEAAFHRRAAVALGLADSPPTLPALDAAAVERRS
ncbi:MAG TPA: glycosyltransferase, partial [Vicinamibacterales bacterium]|nr:glycosyltransferase [Vicinamibacterales bacterium]